MTHTPLKRVIRTNCFERRKMMKKLLVLMLVLGMASMASAGLTITAPATVAAGAPFTVVISGLAADTPAYGSLFTDGLADGDGYTFLPAVGDIRQQYDFFASYGTYDFTVGAGINSLTVDGDWVQLDLVAGAVGDVYNMNMTDDSFTGSLDSATVTVVVPEPITMSLLAVGGLFLRRRK